MKRRVFLSNLAALVGAAITSPSPPRVTSPAPGYLQMHPGSPPPGAVDASMLASVTRELGGRQSNVPGEPKVVAAWGQALGRTVLLAAKPPQPGENWLCWNSGLFEADGASSIGSCGGPTEPLKPLEASGASIGVAGKRQLGVVSGIVTKRAARLRVFFRTGRPLDVVPVDAGDRFPVNFYAGLHRQPEKDQPPCTWHVIRVIAYDKTGRRVAQC